MMTRKEFLQGTLSAAAVVAILPVSVFLEGCAVHSQTLRVSAKENRVRLALIDLPKLTEPGGFVKVYPFGFAHPIVLFQNTSGDFFAVSTTCTHAGCEVRKTKSKFECPCHGSQYDLSGKVIRGPAPAALTRFPVRKEGDFLEIILKEG
ncbi:MAG TPA: Rieske (2Fe-2S) protein [candidate division Zixibacteria bacterium]|nr:Rieske (2Fe-2S) protein [candidate division Zixibacteria bacterium]